MRPNSPEKFDYDDLKTQLTNILALSVENLEQFDRKITGIINATRGNAKTILSGPDYAWEISYIHNDDQNPMVLIKGGKTGNSSSSRSIQVGFKNCRKMTDEGIDLYQSGKFVPYSHYIETRELLVSVIHSRQQFARQF